MKKRYSILAALAVSAGLITATAWACPPVGGHFPGPGMGPPAMHSLKLTDAQHEALFAQMQADARPRHEAMRAAHRSAEALRNLAQAEVFDEAKAKALASEHGQQIAELAWLRARAEAKLSAILTPEQRAQQAKAEDDPPRGKHCRADERSGP
ncbi:MAG: Spy/CpxP family protein refolding chaperone [Rhodocyclaceae bacterium]|nr:Spy/CpxP family protein refolding chaperone [Rhodocyclaceae bacterium]